MNTSTFHSDMIPRLLYMGEVPVRALTAGSAVLYRLFETLPPEKLLIVEDRPGGKQPPGEPLKKVKYIAYSLFSKRWLNTRLRGLYYIYCYWRTGYLPAHVVSQARDFGVEGVIGLGHGLEIWPAYLLAKKLNVPFYLIVHDDWPGTLYFLHPWLFRRAKKRFQEAYRGAKHRFLISIPMQKEYHRLYGCEGTVLYPVQSRNLKDPATLPRTCPPEKPFTFAYVGQAGDPWILNMLARLANVLAEKKARLRIHFSLDPGELRKAGWTADNIEIAPFDPDPSVIQEQLVGKADALYLPMSFWEEHRLNVSFCFPSKTTDYTAARLPILVHAPPYASITAWAASGTALVVDDEKEASLVEAVTHIMQDSALRERLSIQAWASGEKEFSFKAVTDVFLSHLQS